MKSNTVGIRLWLVSNILTADCRILNILRRLIRYLSMILVSGIIPLTSFGAIKPIRTDGNSSYFSVGLIAFNGAPTCSGTIIRHGVLLTAKHCFRDRPYSNHKRLSWSLHFPLPEPQKGSILIPGIKIKKIILDKGENDIAFILYDSLLTEKKLPVEVTNFSKATFIKEDTAAKVIGFPHQDMLFSKTPRVIADNCLFTGLLGTNSGYSGSVSGTNCGGYWGVSGGPVFIEDKVKHSFTSLVGVVTHTFSTKQDGSIDETKIQNDSFGKYINDTTVSLVSSSLMLDEILTLDLSKVPNAEHALPPQQSEICGYSSFLELMKEAKRAVDTIQKETHFKPTFWIKNNPAFENVALENMITKNRTALAERSVFESKSTWVKMVFQDFDFLRETESMRVFREKKIGQLKFTQNLEECDALECTNYFDFTILMNWDAVKKLFLNLDHSTARKNVWAIHGHEYGHFILDYYYLTSGQYSSYEEVHSKVDPLKYHLTVDAVGMLLTSTDRNSFVKVLRQTGVKEIMGQHIWSGDIGLRLNCLENLP